jgi:hypothetical protein
MIGTYGCPVLGQCYKLPPVEAEYSKGPRNEQESERAEDAVDNRLRSPSRGAGVLHEAAHQQASEIHQLARAVRNLQFVQGIDQT